MSSIQRMSKISHCRQKREGAKKAASSHMKAWLKSYQIWCNSLKNWHDVIDNDLPSRIKLFLNSE